MESLATTSNSTQNIGRIWTDKSVFDSNGYTFENGQLKNTTVKSEGSDFLVGLSAIASYSNEKSTVTTTTPLDIVLVLDVSGSMDNSLGTTYTYTETYRIDQRYNYYIQLDNGEWQSVSYSYRYNNWYYESGRDRIVVDYKRDANDNTSGRVQFYTRNSQTVDKIDALQNAANQFISSVNTMNNQITEEGDKHRIAIVKYADDSYRYAIGNDRGAGGVNNYNYTQVVSDFTTDANSLTSNINSLRPGGATSADYGLTMAQNVINGGTYGGYGNSGTYIGARDESEKVIIFFTDGEPNHSSDWDGEVAAEAVNIAHGLKEAGATIYSIGVVNGADPNNTTTNLNKYLHAVSSNYKDAIVERGYWGYPWNNLNLGDRTQEEDGTTPQYYYAAEDADQLNQVFDDITSSLPIDEGSGSPIEEVTTGGANNTPGYLTFTDTLGNYTEISGDTMYLAFADKIYEGKPNAERTKWEFNETIQGGINDAYPEDVNLSQIDITVNKGTDLSTGDTITIKIPASLIPMRSYNVDVDKKTLDISDTYPLRLFYGVSVKDDVIAALNNPGDNSETYSQIMSSQKDGDDISFYSNSFVKDSNKGSTIATFTPSNGNSFYYYPVNTQLYTDVTCETKATRSNISGESTLYYQDSYWELTGNGNNAEQKTVVESISRLGQDWSNVRYDDDGNAYIAQHAQRLDRPSTLVDPKDQEGNKTGTASNVLYPEWGSDMVSQYLGNNGKISYPAPGQLEIKKTVNWGNASEETKTTKNSFDFSVKLFTVDGEGNQDDLTGSYPYAIYENGQDPIEDGTGTVSNGDTITLKAGQRVIISGLPDGAKFEVTETNANKNGFTTTDEYAGASQDANKEDGKVEGTIEKGAQQSVSFTNTYNAKSVNLGEDHSFKVEKVLGGRDWRSTDEFSFILTGISSTGSTGDIPMPKLTRIEITEEDLDQSTNKYIDTFGDIEFKEPGRYRYRIDEDSDSSPIPGINYSDAIYRATVNVTDDGMGNLQIDSVLIELMYDDDGNSHVTDGVGEEDTDGIMTFTNKYDVSSITEGIQGKKIYDDTTGDNLIEAGKFTFQLEAKGGYVTGSGSAENLSISADETPMPQGAQDNKITTGNVGNGFTFEDIPFNGDHVGNTYVYEVSEVAGTEDGMIYDTSTIHTIEIQVTEEEIENDPGHYHIVATVLGDAANPDNVAFTNTYDPNDVTLTGDSAIHGTKVLDGRDIKDDESFYFQLKQTSGSTVLNTPEIVEVNKTTGMNFGFSNLTFSKVGTYTFEVIEVADINGTELQNGNGMTYSDNVATVKVEVKDNYDGTLGANVTYKNSHSQETTEAVFTNVYNASMNYGSEGAGGIKITKQMLDRPMNNNEFEFKITGLDDAKDLITKDDESFKNTAAGMNQVISMSKLQSLTFDQDDAGKTYSFIVDEVEPEEAEKLAGVTYDQSQYRVDIQVFDNGNGTMHTLTTVTKIKDSQGNDVNDVVINQANSDDANYVVPTFGFVNDYNPNPAEIGEDADNALQVVKQVRGADSPDGVSYGFTLTATGDNVTNIEGLDDNNQLFVSTNGVIKAGDSQTLSFDKLTFNEPGTYTFTVQENDPVADDGWTFDTNPKTVTVTVTDLNTDGVYDGNLYIFGITGNPVIVRNRYEANSVVVGDDEDDLQVTKQIVGAPALSEFDFELKLTSENAENVEGLGEEGTIVKSTIGLTGKEDSETVDFGDLTFTKEGTYTFEVKETTTTDAKGWTYDNSVKTITVKVTDENHDGQLDAEVEGNNPKVINTYDAEDITIGTDGEAGIIVQKTLAGRAWEANDSFEFEISAVTEGAPLPEAKTISLSGTEGTNDAVTNTFGSITYTKDMLDGAMSKDFVYTITETSTGGNGVVVDSAKERTVTVTITDDASGALSATISYDNSAASSESDKAVTAASAFTNTYDASASTGIPTNFTLKKVFTGHEWTEDYAFQFKLTPVNGAPMPETNEANGVIIDAEGNAIKTVTGPQTTGETTFDFGAITYDQAGEYVYTVTEIQGDNAGIEYSRNIAEVTVTVTDKGESGSSTGKLVASTSVKNSAFENTYSSELDYVGKGGIELVKNLTGYDLTKDNQFTFTLNAADEASKVKAGMENMSQDVFNTEDTMDANGLSTSTIQLLPKMQKFTQDDVGKVYEYTVSETSEQKPGYTNDTTKYKIQISTSDDGSGTLIVSTRIKGTNGTDITYKYTQSKQKAETGVAQVVFNNTYTSSTNTEGYDASVNLTGTKTLTNRPMVDGEFQFNVLSNGSVVLSGTNTADGIVTFTPINYTNDQLIQDHANGIASKEGNTYTYVYDVEEVTPGNGVSIVAGKFSVTVKVTDNGDGKLVTNVIYPEGGLAFENAYGQSANAELNIHGTKKLAENGTNHPDITGKFQFTITGSDGAPMPEQTTVTNDASGNINFGKIVYTMQNVFGDDGQQTILEEEPVVDQEMPIAEEQTTEDGTVSEDVVGLTEQVETYSEKREKTFTYTITESGSLPGVTNDSAKVINVKVIDNGDGTISVTSDTQGTFTFVNTYVPDPTDETSPTDSAVTIKKVLDGRTLKADEFSFTMMDENGNGVQATNAEDGSVVFPKLTFDKEGIYTYTISETNDNKGGVTYDTTTYKAIATVTDDTSGKLKVEWKVTDAQGKEINEITFNNKYTVQPTSLTLGATKVLEGRELADKEFLFVLSDEEGNVVEEAYNDKTGKVTFSDLTFDKAGTYNYTVTEKNTNAKGITYDESVYNIQVDVVDNEDGTLNMTTTTTKDGEVSSIVFKNKAEKDSVPEQPEKGDTSNTSTQTYAGLFTSLAVNAAALAGIATLLKKRNAKK